MRVIELPDEYKILHDKNVLAYSTGDFKRVVDMQGLNVKQPTFKELHIVYEQAQNAFWKMDGTEAQRVAAREYYANQYRYYKLILIDQLKKRK